MNKQELRNADGELLSVTEGLRTVARHMIRLCDDLWSVYTATLDPEKAAHFRTMREEACTALKISEEPLDWSTCPCCGSGAENISYENVEIEEGDAFQKCSCNACDASWGEWYRADERVIYDGGTGRA